MTFERVHSGDWAVGVGKQKEVVSDSREVHGANVIKVRWMGGMYQW